eukprot:4577642-Amphidinium_carterae.1
MEHTTGKLLDASSSNTSKFGLGANCAERHMRHVGINLNTFWSISQGELEPAIAVACLPSRLVL